MTTVPVAFPLETRSVGAVTYLQHVLPGATLSALWLLTWLGSVALLLGLLASVYWFGARDRGAFGVGAALGAFALTVALKSLFALPRPPASVHLIAAAGYGFPSGHALASTVVWGYLAYALDWRTRRLRVALATAIVAVVVLSRVALGVHYAVDVVVGAGLGVGYLVVLTRTERVEVAFGVAVAVAALATVATGAGGDAMLLLGGSLAGALLWRRLAVPAAPWRREGLLPAVGGGGGIGAVLFVGYRWPLAPPVEFVVGAATVATLLALPVLVERYRSRGGLERAPG